jgi:hypothetical protein
MNVDNINLTTLYVVYTRSSTDDSVPSGSEESYKLLWLQFTSVLPVLAPRQSSTQILKMLSFFTTERTLLHIYTQALLII